MRCLFRSAQWVLAALATLSVPVVWAQRDPTLPPAESGQSAATLVVKPGPSLDKEGGMAIVVRDGQRFLVVDTRLYAVGQKLGQARIERISETEIWLREGGSVRRQSVFAGIERRTATASAAPVRVPATVSAPKSAPK